MDSEPHYTVVGLEWNGQRWYKNRKDGYYRNRDGYLLHKAVWEHYHGPVPDGFVIHHDNHNKDDNRLANFVCVKRGDHALHHLGDDPKRVAAWADEQNPERARARSTTLWKNRVPKAVLCAYCGVEFYSVGMRAKFCSGKCRAMFYRRQRAASPDA